MSIDEKITRSKRENARVRDLDQVNHASRLADFKNSLLRSTGFVMIVLSVVAGLISIFVPIVAVQATGFFLGGCSLHALALLRDIRYASSNFHQ